MEEMMERQSNVEGNIAGAAQDVLTQNLNSVEAKVDTVLKDAIHEVRSEAEDVVDQTLNRFKGTWEQQRPKIEDFMASHPWMVLGGLLLLGYFFAGTQRARQR
jgi:hypothetical protein